MLRQPGSPYKAGRSSTLLKVKRFQDAEAATATTRRFECVEGASNKFWQVTVSGTMVTVHFGRIGTAGQQETKTFADPAAAAKHAEKKVKEKLSRGYHPAS